MHLALGLVIEIMSVLNASFSIYYYTLFIKNTTKEDKTVVVVKNTGEETEIKKSNSMHQYAVFSLVMAIGLLIMGLSGFTWDITVNTSYDYYSNPKTTNNTFMGIIIMILIANYIATFIIVYSDGGLMDIASSKAKGSITSTMAISLLFLIHLIFVGIYKILQNSLWR
jgi:hypothetical protein